MWDEATGKYRFKSQPTACHGDEMIDLWKCWCRNTIRSLKRSAEKLGRLGQAHHAGRRVQLVGDDLFVTNVHYLERGTGAAQRHLIKINQTGTLTETPLPLTWLWAVSLPISHRSGETGYDHRGFAVACGPDQSGGSRTDRVAKYNRLLVIEGTSMPPSWARFWRAASTMSTQRAGNLLFWFMLISGALILAAP